MARILIVGCGCRGAELGRALIERGHAVRGTTRRDGRTAELESLGIEPAIADPDRLATLTPLLEGVSALCWLMGSAAAPPARLAALHGDRLESLLESLVDTHVRGFVYERAGTVEEGLLSQGEQIARRAEADHHIRVALVAPASEELQPWLAAAVRAVDDVLAA